MAKIKRIEDHTNAELELAIAMAAKSFRLFWIILHGVDAFLERRKRREDASNNAAHDEAMQAIHNERIWGDN